MHHLPHGMNWDAQRVVKALSDLGVPATASDHVVQIEIADTEEPTMLERLIRGIVGSRPSLVTIKHNPEKFIRNIVVHYDPLKLPAELPLLKCITVALRQCGCVVKSDRQIADDYCPDSAELAELFAQVERLQRQQELLVAEQDFGTAIVKRDEERAVLRQIDQFLFRAVK